MFKCKICGSEFERRCYAHPYEDICSSKCFSENFWLERIENKNEHIIINHVCYWVGEEDSTSYFRGFNGRRFIIKMLDGNKEFVTTNLWCNGDIPEKYWDKLPNNAEFITNRND